MCRLPLGTGSPRYRLFRASSQLGDKVHKVGRMFQTRLRIDDIYRESSEEWSGRLPLTSTTPLVSWIDAPPALRDTAPERMMHWDMQILPT